MAFVKKVIVDFVAEVIAEMLDASATRDESPCFVSDPGASESCALNAGIANDLRFVP